MSRVTSWEDDEPYPNASALFGANVERSLKGKRGQALLREIEEALLAMPEKRLRQGIVCRAGEVCTLGAVAVHRLVKKGKSRAEALAEIEAEAKEAGQVAEDDWDSSEDETFDFLRALIGIKSHPLAWTLVYENDEAHAPTPEALYDRMLKWVRARLTPTA